MVGWFEAFDDWGEDAALTRSRHLIDGSLSLDGFRVGWMAAMAALDHFRTLQTRKVDPYSIASSHCEHGSWNRESERSGRSEGRSPTGVTRFDVGRNVFP